jgi:hypothetical protein
MSNTENGKQVTLAYQSHGRVTERTFEDLTDDDLVFTVAALAGRRFRTRLHDADMEQLKAARTRQMEWYATRMVEALYDGLGWWRALLPHWVFKRTVQAQMDYLMDLTATWTGELIGMQSEVVRASQPVPVLRPHAAPENGPRIRCTCCSRTTLLTPVPTEGWTWSPNNLPFCPDHSVADLETEATR